MTADLTDADRLTLAQAAITMRDVTIAALHARLDERTPPTMTKKDYLRIASAIAKTEGMIDSSARAWVIQFLADELYADNPKFNYAKFATACRGQA